MKRTALTILALLVLGVLATYAVSWYCGWRVLYDVEAKISQAHRGASRPANTADIYHVDAAEAYVIGAIQTPGAARIQFMALRPDRTSDMDFQRGGAEFDELWRDWGPSPASWSPLRRLHFDPPELHLLREPYRTDMIFEARGWPMLATWCALDSGVEGGFHLGLGHIPGTFATTERVLPYRPIWFGLAVNTLFYATILGVIRLGVLQGRRRWRIAHKRCPACAYPVGTAPMCTECGAALR